LVAESIVMFQSHRTQDWQRIQGAEEISLNYLGGIRAFIERCGQIESISDQMRELVEARWPDLVRKLPPKH
jgi:hypothetical protein